MITVLSRVSTLKPVCNGSASVLRDDEPVATYRATDDLARRYRNDDLLRETYLKRIRETNSGVAVLSNGE